MASSRQDTIEIWRDEPGPGGVRVGQTRSDLDCRVVATSRRVAPTECDSRLPLFGRGSTCRLRLLDSWPPPGSGVVFDLSRGSTRVSRPVAPTESDSSDKRRTWAVAQLVRLFGLCRTKMSQRGATRPTSRQPSRRSTRRLVRLLGLCRTKMSRRGATRPTSRRSSRRSTRRLVRLLRRARSCQVRCRRASGCRTHQHRAHSRPHHHSRRRRL